MAEEQKPQQPLEILVIDDDAIIGMEIKDIIERAGDKATLAIGGQAGIDEYAQRHEAKPFDGVISDYRMPRVTGVDVFMVVKNRSPETPFYFVTASDPKEIYQDLSNQHEEFRPDGIIKKPFQNQNIRDALSQIRIQKYGPENPLTYELPKTQS